MRQNATEATLEKAAISTIDAKKVYVKLRSRQLQINNLAPGGVARACVYGHHRRELGDLRAVDPRDRRDDSRM